MIPRRILVADDDRDIRRLVALTLELFGHTVLQAENGDGALALVRQEHPDAAILDVMMPGLTGIEIAELMSKDPATADIPVILLSARG